jgi:transcriptional regulator with XRE-family HTH domain
VSGPLTKSEWPASCSVLPLKRFICIFFVPKVEKTQQRAVNPALDEFVINLHAALKAKGMTAADLCRATGIPKATVSYYLNGKTRPRLEYLRAICKALDLPDDLRYAHGRQFAQMREQGRLCNIWKGMRQRCYWPKHSSYKYYGAKGITVCDEWRASFAAFYEWAITHGYQEHLTLDRIDPYGNYGPDNCRWATYKEQAQNKRRPV